MARTLQYDLNENFRNCLKEVYRRYQQKSIKDINNIKDVKFTSKELQEIINNFYKNISDSTESSRKGILKQLKIYLDEEKNQKDKNKSFYSIPPLTNLIRLNDRKIENEILYVGLLKYTKIFNNINNAIYEILGNNRQLTLNKDRFILKIRNKIREIESHKSNPLSTSTIHNNVRRSIENIINVRIILDSTSNRSLNENQIRIREYFPDYRVILILFLQELDEKNRLMPSFDTILSEYDFIRYFFLNKASLEHSLRIALKQNLFSYQQQINDAIKVNFNMWELSYK